MAFDITASASGSAVAYGRVSAFGYGFSFSVSGRALTVDGVTYTMSGSAPFTGTYTVSVPTKEITGMLEVGNISVSVAEKSVRGGSFTSTLVLGGVTIDRSGTVPTGGSATDGGWAGVGASFACYCRVFGYPGAGSITITPQTPLPFAAQEASVSTGGSGTGSAANVAYPGDTYSWSWSTSESAGYSAHAEGSWSITRNGSSYIALPYFGSWANGSSWRSEAYGESITAADRTASYNLVAYAGSGVSSEPMEARLAPKGTIVSFTGSTSESLSLHNRRRWAGGDVLAKPYVAGNNNLVTDHKSEGGPIEAHWRSLDVNNNGFNRMALRLWKWDALTLLHDADCLVDDGSSLTPSGGQFDGVWSAASGGSVAVASGAIKATGASGKTLKRTFINTATTYMGIMQGWPCLKIRMRCTAAAHNIGVRIKDISGDIFNSLGSGGEPKIWDIRTGAANTWTDLYIDLSAEHNGLPLSRWSGRLLNATAVPGPDSAGAHFGGVFATQIEFYGLGAGDYEIDDMTLVDRETSTGTEVDPLIHYQFIQAGGEEALLGQGICAGQGVVEIVGHNGLGLVTLPSRLSPTSGQIAAGGGLWRYPGWGMSDASPRTGTVSAVYEYHPILGGTTTLVYDTYADRECSDLPSAWLAGQGYIYNGGATPWSPMFDDGAIGAGDIPAQWSVASFQWEWPEALDSLSDPFGFAAILPAGGVWGRMLQLPATTSTDAYRPPASGDAKATQVGGPITDTDTIDTGSGFYALASFGQEGLIPNPGGGSAPLYNISADGSSQSPKPSQVMPIVLGRRRLVLVDRGDADSGESLSLTQSFTGRLARAWSDSGQLWLELRSQSDGAWIRRDTGIAGGRPSIQWDTFGASGNLLMAYESSGIKWRDSTDEGGTWSVATTISSTGTHPTQAISQSGVRHFFWYLSGAIKRRSYDAQMTEVIAVGSVVASGAADDSVGAVVLQNGNILLTYRNTSGQLVAVTSTDGGVTFS